MRRSPELAPLSRDHHVALEHALRLRRAGEHDVVAVVSGFLAFLVGPGRAHFAQEEELLAPAIPSARADLAQRMMGEHLDILRRAERLGTDPCVTKARALGDLLARHVRFEERELFPLLEAEVPAERMRDIARALSRT
jgi:hypothetical protein